MSFEIALSGINAVNSQLGSISNNIANTGTHGYKAGRTTFSSAFAGSQAMGVEARPNSQNMGRSGGLQPTGRNLDAALDGNGFFVVRDAAVGTSYTRLGIFNADDQGFLVDSFGRRVQGFSKNAAGATGALGDITIPAGGVPAQASGKLQFAGNMSAGWTPVTGTAGKDNFNHSSVSTVFDSLGNPHNLTQYFSKTAAGEVTVNYTLDGNSVGAPLKLTFDTAGKLTSPATPQDLDLGTPAGAEPLKLAVDYSGTTQFAGQASTVRNDNDGYAAGTRTGVSLGSNGDVVVSYSNGKKQVVAAIAVANFPNEQGLQAVSDSSWEASNESGAPLLSTPGSGMAGKLAAGALEKSNVDMTSELVDLMTAQRNYQANTKVIAAENQVIQSLMQAV
ncbi:flagellar biosynthesis protein FlgE [Xenophilus sp. AP218F]|nr:flagellar hook-basal body complex protein [Chromobacterium sp. ASV5]OWY37346.1 flagellar biosynthesis protein FlgE [Xenophilus sp. AP218F]